MSVTARGQITVTNIDDGVGIASVTITYARSSQGTTPPEDSAATEKPFSYNGKELVWGTKIVVLTVSATWTEDIPELTDAEPWLWTRTVTTYTDGKETTSYSVGYKGSDGDDGQKGSDGDDGQNAVQMALDNEMDGVGCDSDGKVATATTVKTTVRVYDGATLVTPTAVDAGDLAGVQAQQGIIGTATGITWTLARNKSLTEDRYTAEVKATYKGVTYVKTFTLTAVKAGADGESGAAAEVWNLMADPTVLSFTRDSSNALTPTKRTLTCGAKKTVGKAVTTYEGTAANLAAAFDGSHYVYIRAIGTTAWTQFVKPQDVASSVAVAGYEFCLSTAAGASAVAEANIVDKQTVAVVKSGAKGDTGSGKDGESTFSFGVTPVVIDLTEDDLTNTGGSDLFTPKSTKAAQVTAYYGTKAATLTLTDITGTNCEAGEGSTAGTIELTSVDGEAVTYDGKTLTDTNGNTVYLPVGAAYISFKATATYTDNGTVKTATQQMQVAVTVAYTKSIGTFTYTNSELLSKIAEMSELEEKVSEIRQTADEISLTVKSKTYRPNLLRGTDFKRALDGWAWNNTNYVQRICKSVNLGGVNSMLLTTAGTTTYTGVKWTGLTLKSGTSYMASFRYRVDEKPASSFTLKMNVKNSSNTVLTSITLTIAAATSGWMTASLAQAYTPTAALTGVSVELWSCGASGGTAYVCAPTVREGVSTAWGLSEQDVEYIGGNLLENTGTLVKGGNLSAVNGTVTTGDDGVAEISRSGASVTLQWYPTTLAKNTEYMFSFEAKGSGSLGAHLHGGGATPFTETSDKDYGTTANGEVLFTLASDWQRYWVHWNSGSATPTGVNLVLYNTGSNVTIRKPKLELGATLTEWTADSATQEFAADVEIKGGMRIYADHTDVIANQFNIYNSDGEQTFGVDEDGTAFMNNILLGGLLWKQKVEIASLTDAEKYFDVSQFSSVQVGLTAVPKKLKGIYVFKGALGSYTIADVAMPSMQYDTKNGWLADAATEDEAMQMRAMAGNSVIIVNKSTTHSVQITCYAPTWTDQYVKLTSNAKANALTASTTTDTGGEISDPWDGQTPYKDDSTSGLGMWAGRERDSVTITLPAVDGTNNKKPMAAVLNCVCEIADGYECVRWTGGAGWGWNNQTT